MLGDAPPFDDDEQTDAFVTIDEIPEDLLDVAPAEGEEGDDSILTDGALPANNPAPSAAKPPGEIKRPVRVVPLRRTIKRGMNGPDVVATKRALSHAGFLRWPKKWPRLAGPFWVRALKKFQANHKITATGVYNAQTHRALVRGGHFDKYGALLMGQAPRDGSRKGNVRDRLEAIALYGYYHRLGIYYTQGSDRMTIVRNKVRFPWFDYVRQLGEDCSSYATGCYYSAKLPDPNGLGYSGWGFTGTLAVHGRQTVAVRSGDLAFYGPSPYRHVVVHIGTGTRCVSHGSSLGPLLLPTFRYRGDYSHSRTYI
jgi:hypothetical protein